MSIPAYIDGDALPADDVNDWMVPIAAYKSQSSNRSSVTTPYNDWDMRLNVPSSGLFIFSGFLIYTGAAGSHFKWTWNVGSTNAVINVQAAYYNTGGTLVGEFQVGTETHAAYTDGTASDDRRAIILNGFLKAGGTSGNILLQWSQNNSSGTAVTLWDRSHLILHRIEA